MKQNLIKQSLDEWLDQVSYAELNSTAYVPSQFAFIFMNMIKLINGAEGESHKTPPVHLKMLDKLTSGAQNIVNLVFRGAAKTTLFGEYFFPIVAILGELPNLGKVSGAIYVSDSMDNGAKSLRKNMEHRYYRSDFLQEWLPEAKFTDNFIEFINREGHQFGLRLFGAKTGLRGTKVYGKRPTLCVLDDLISDEAGKSKADMQAIKDTVYKGVNYALDPVNRLTIFNGTPFNSEDIIIQAVESGAWDANVWPVCERFPCEREEFVGAWEDRFSYDFVKQQYDEAVLNGQTAAFYQEMMLRISSDDDRLVQDGEIRWFNRKLLLDTKQNYNFYITTDFATSAKQTADFSVISVWAYSANGDWLWVDGVCERMTMDKTIDHLFRLVQIYKPQTVGVEITGQQGAFISWLQREMMTRNIWFNFASSEKSGAPGIRPVTDKLSRFNLVVPWFKAGKMWWPEEMRDTKIVGEFMQEIRLATTHGLKGKDDCLDTISQLGYLKPWKPQDAVPMTTDEKEMWEEENNYEERSALSSYIV